MKRRPATYPPIPPAKPPPSDPTLTVDTFIAEVSIDSHRSILVYLREHGGRQYVRWRVFHRHRRHGNWYPDKHRSFVVPLAGADGLAGAIAAAGSKQAVTSKPAWLQAIDAYREHRYRCMTDLNAPPRVLDRERRKMLRAGA
jgi:hypothetical protein